MSRTQIGFLWLAMGALTAGSAIAQSEPATFSGERAMQHVRRAVEFGPRPSGTRANSNLQGYILEQLRASCQCQVVEDVFIAVTPQGDMEMLNIQARFPGSGPAESRKTIAITGHYDTKRYPNRTFVGANDGGSSTGLLLELARALAGQERTDDVILVFFDGEEAVREQWAGEDNLYGSRHLAEWWERTGTLASLKALINVDMIGDRDLVISRELNSNRAVMNVVWAAARDLGHGGVFVDSTITIEDDHIPFLERGAPAIDIIDFDYPHWHEDSDTLDKLSPRSLQVVGEVLLEAINRLEAR